MRSPHPAPHLIRFAAGVGLLTVCALGLPGRALAALRNRTGGDRLLDFALGMVGFVIAIRAVGPLVRGAFRSDADASPSWADFERANLPRRVFFLLLAVARADGRTRDEERELVRRFLLERFVDPVTAQDLRSWEAQAMRDPDVAELARQIAGSLDDTERDTLFFWSCLLAFADGGFLPEEHVALQAVARGLGLEGPHARGLFHQAREHHLRNGGPRRNGAAGPSAPRTAWTPTTDRERALAVLGLEPGAGPEDVRRRHRELVRKFHPDAQRNLGPVAAAEATDRFRRVQHAYELLSRAVAR